MPPDGFPAAAETAADFAGILYTDAPANGEADAAEPFEPIELEKRALLRARLTINYRFRH